jgi:hypothetical protein
VGFLANQNVNRLALHASLHALAWCASAVFLSVFLLRAGITPAGIFLATAGIRALRFVLRPFVLPLIAAYGLRRTLMMSTLVFALQYPVLALVDGAGPALVAFCIVSALGEGLYFTCYHAFFAALGDAEHRGSQLGMLQMFAAIASVLGPALGGVALAAVGPRAAFGVAALIEIAAVLPLRRVADVAVAPARPRDIVAAVHSGVFLFLTDGWIMSCTIIAWDIVMFRALGGRFDAFGGALAAAALFGALGGLVLGRAIDLSRARYAASINAAVSCFAVILKAACGSEPAAVVLTASLAAMLAALYSPSLMTAVYNDAKRAACPLRFQFAAEGCWDVGAALACLAGAAVCVAGLSLQSVILMALPVIAIQTMLLSGRYQAHGQSDVDFGRSTLRAPQ